MILPAQSVSVGSTTIVGAPGAVGAAREHGQPLCRGANMSDRTCSIEGCAKPAHRRGWCRMHYGRWERHRDPLVTLNPGYGLSLAERLKAGIERDGDGCWLWTGAISDTGYGSIRLRGNTLNAHRVSYEVHVGPVPAGLELDHLCRVRACVNPAHLEPVTHAENARRGRGGQHNAVKTHCKNGHESTPENTYRNKLGHRSCRECARLRPRSPRKVAR